MLATSIADIARELRAPTRCSEASLDAAVERWSTRAAAAPTVEVPALELPDAECDAPALTHDRLDLVASHVRTYRAKDLRAFARAWACFCLFPSLFPAPKRFLRARRVELALARLGVVDPRGGDIAGVPF